MSAIKTVALPESNLYAENFDRAEKAIKNGWDVVVEDDYGTYTSPGRSVTGETASWDSYTGTLAATRALLGAPIDLGTRD